MDDFFSSPNSPDDLHTKNFISAVLSYEIEKECPGIFERY
jgi:hypothetical protein